jgi:glucose-fructose oxidoreductase
VLVGKKGTISSYDFEPSVRVQTENRPEGESIPVDEIKAPHRNPVEHMIHCLKTGESVIGPLDPATARIGQQIVDTAYKSAREKRTLKLLG